jgi:uncharacterized membrane protein
MTNTIVALYDDFTTAQKAIQDLIDSGFDPNEIGIAANNVSGEYDHLSKEQQLSEQKTTKDQTRGAGIGAGIGGLGGLLVGLGLLAVPGIGAAVVAGPIVAGLTGAVVGATGGGLVGALTNMGVGNEQAEAYAEGVRRGGTIITVTAPEPRTNEAVTVISRHNPVNINERMSEWHASGWTGHDIHAEPYTPQEVAQERQKNQGYTY